MYDGMKDVTARTLRSLVYMLIASNSCGRPRVSQPVRNEKIKKNIVVPRIPRRNTNAEYIHGLAVNTLFSFYSFRYRDTPRGMPAVHGLPHVDSGPSIGGDVSADKACVNSIHGVVCHCHIVCHMPIRALPGLPMRRSVQLL